MKLDASDNCRDGFSVYIVTRQCEYIIKIYSVLIFSVRRIAASLTRSLCVWKDL